MKYFSFIFAVIFLALLFPRNLFSQTITVGVSHTKLVYFVIDFNEEIISGDTLPQNYILHSGDQKAAAKMVSITPGELRIGFQVEPGNYSVFEGLTSDSSSYEIENLKPVILSDSTIQSGELSQITKNKIPIIPLKDWNKYIVDEYASDYLFPHTVKVGTGVGLKDSTRTTYFIDLVQSDKWVSNSSLPIFWGIKGHLSTDPNDNLNYFQIYPMTVLFTQMTWKTAGMIGIETDNQGFGKFGRGVAKGEIQVRLPYNPVDLTFGSPRVRVNPVISFAIQQNIAWSNKILPDSLKNSTDINLYLRYGIPVAVSYYIELEVTGNYSTVTKQVLHQLNVSLGYIADGNVRVMASYREGYREISYFYDRQLLLGLAFDILNKE